MRSPFNGVESGGDANPSEIDLPPVDLPTELTSFIGREHEIAEVDLDVALTRSLLHVVDEVVELEH